MGEFRAGLADVSKPARANGVVYNRPVLTLAVIDMKRLDDGAAVACSLNDAEFQERRALARRTLLKKITGAKRIDHGLVVTLDGGPSLRSDLETFITLERQCCEFLEFTISQETAGPKSRTELRITGKPEAAATIEIFAQAVSDRL